MFFRIAFGFLATLSLCGVAAAAPATTPQGATWDEVKKLPDWEGVWVAEQHPPPVMPFNDKGKAQWAALQAIRKVGGDTPSRAKHCLLQGFPGGRTGPEEYTVEWLITPGQVTMTQVQGYVRRIYTDGRKHHKGPLTMQGDAIGHWEGGTLVADTIGLDPGNEMFYGFSGGANMHVVERVYLKGADKLVIDNVVDAPAIFTEPYPYGIAFDRHRDWTPLEMDCAQNNRDLDAKGNQIMNLQR